MTVPGMAMARAVVALDKPNGAALDVATRSASLLGNRGGLFTSTFTELGGSHMFDYNTTKTQAVLDD